MPVDLYNMVREIAQDFSTFYEQYLPQRVSTLLEEFKKENNQQTVDKYIHFEIKEDYTSKKFWKNKVFLVEAFLESARNDAIPMLTHTHKIFDELVLSRQTENIREIIYDYKRILIKADWEKLEYQEGNSWIRTVKNFKHDLTHELIHLLAHYDYLAIEYNPPALKFQQDVFYNIVREGVPEYLTRRLMHIDLSNIDYSYGQFTSVFNWLLFWSADISEKRYYMDTLIPYIYFSGRDANIFLNGEAKDENWRIATAMFEDAVKAQLGSFIDRSHTGS